MFETPDWFHTHKPWMASLIGLQIANIIGTYVIVVWALLIFDSTLQASATYYFRDMTRGLLSACLIMRACELLLLPLPILAECTKKAGYLRPYIWFLRVTVVISSVTCMMKLFAVGSRLVLETLVFITSTLLLIGLLYTSCEREAELIEGKVFVPSAKRKKEALVVSKDG